MQKCETHAGGVTVESMGQCSKLNKVFRMIFAITKCGRQNFHDESTFQANDEQTFLGYKVVMKPKNESAGIMVSDFIDEKMGTYA